MKALFLASLVALTFSACGQQEKGDDPFGKIDQGQKDGEMTEASFRRSCSAKKGTFDPSGKICFYGPQTKQYGHDINDAKDVEGKPVVPTVRKELAGANQKIVGLGKVGAGSVVYGEVKGGQAVRFYVNNQPVTVLSEPRLAPFTLPAGDLDMMLLSGTYEYLNVYVTSCFSRTAPSVPCPAL